MDFKYAQSWLLGIVCFVYGIYRIIGGSDKPFNWVDVAAIIGFCYSVYITQIAGHRRLIIYAYLYILCINIKIHNRFI